MATAENTKPAATSPAIDPFAYFGIVLNADGTLTRVRLYIHQKALESTSSNDRLPVFIYFPGGAFLIGTPASPLYHDFCSFMAVELPAIVVSVDYRLAPEHRLPAAYLDCVEALQWIKTAPHEWLAKYGDLSRCYTMGASAGGNIAYHVPAFLRDVDLTPLKIRGMILVNAFFSGTKRTESELRLENDEVLPLIVNDMTWTLSLPVGADRDHEYCNPAVESELGACDWIKKAGCRVLVKGCDGDPLLDRQKELVKSMQEKGIEVVSKFDEGGCHVIELIDPSNAKDLCLTIRNFMSSAA
ncbi:Alpha/beta hydrolase-3 [Heracleum sosnowskyi]|uniref:Alpha/beta hydrolase-3 n=1 Tax=Heracleum sosnowskyi TaxID=360622 RepID=A0AAD8M7I5_9APIA|nr:Alpha/beta hydrolase-3 [Heracleum sosnowskyi]